MANGVSILVTNVLDIRIERRYNISMTTREDWYLLQLEMLLYNLGESMFGKPLPTKDNNPYWFPNKADKAS